MKVELTDIGYCRKRMCLAFDPEEITRALDESYTSINNLVRIKGFRKGKTPRRSLEKKFSSEAAGAARQELLKTHLAKALDDSRLRPMSPLDDKRRNEPIRPGQPYVMEFEMTVEPDFVLPQYLGMELDSRPIEVSDADIDRFIEVTRYSLAKMEEVSGLAIEGDILTVNIRVVCEGEEIKRLEGQCLRVAGDKLFDLPCPELVEKFTGASPEDIIRLTLDLPMTHPVHALRGKPAEVEVAIKEIKRPVLPPLDDTLAVRLGTGNLGTLRRLVREKLTLEAAGRAMADQSEEIIDKLTVAADFQPPQDILDAETERRIAIRLSEEKEKFKDNALYAEVETELRERLRPELRKNAARGVKWLLLCGRIAREENVQVNSEDMAQQIESLAKTYHVTPAQMAKRIRDFNGTDAMRAELLSMKVIGLIAASAKTGRLSIDRSAGETSAINAESAESVNGNKDLPAPGGG
ncbi:MAG: trigger factor, partial [Planctomycetota bacterium]|nr:trigger factor [Planctomycetota bacterium]